MAKLKCYFCGRPHWRGGMYFAQGDTMVDTTVVSEADLALIAADKELREVDLPKPKAEPEAKVKAGKGK